MTDERIDSSELMYQKECPDFKTAVTSLKFFHIWAMVFTASCHGMLIVNVYKGLGYANGFDDVYLSALGGVGAVMNGISKLVCASVQDKLGFRKVLGFVLIL